MRRLDYIIAPREAKVKYFEQYGEKIDKPHGTLNCLPGRRRFDVCGVGVRPRAGFQPV
jgi:hypothetical protein